MRTVFEEEEEEIAQPDPGQDREVTIGATTLLAIFFGLVLICGLFFGLGYTVGRRAPSEAAQLPAETPTPSSSALQSVDNQPKPSAASQPAPTPVADESQSSATDAPADAQPAAETAATPASATSSQVKPALVPAPQPAAATSKPPVPAPAVVTAALPVSAAASAATSAASAPGIMVQIAAISNPADANVLVGALQKHGFAVTARRLPGDSLIHVQAGPFSSRAEANAIKQKLLSDGYNAFVR